VGFWGFWGYRVTSHSTARRNRIATLRAAAAGAAAVVACTLLLAGCTAGTADAGPSNGASSVPQPSATGTWTPPATDAPEGPKTPAPVPTQSAKIDEPVDFGSGVQVSLVSVKSTSVTARTPGELSGPAVLVTVTVKNDSTDKVNVDSAVVSLTADKGGFGVGTTAGDPKPLAGDIAPGKSTTGTYMFMLDPAKGRSVTVSVNYGAGEPVAVFTGKSS
jgi:hypothetical protein